MKTQPLTALERELLVSVERLVMACETSAAELRGLEARSTSKIETQLVGLVSCVTLLMKSHQTCVSTLADLLRAEQNYETLDARLQLSLKLAKAAEKQLSDR